MNLKLKSLEGMRRGEQMRASATTAEIRERRCGLPQVHHDDDSDTR
jgi:hypothetical protein